MEIPIEGPKIGDEMENFMKEMLRRMGFMGQKLDTLSSKVGDLSIKYENLNDYVTNSANSMNNQLAQLSRDISSNPIVVNAIGLRSGKKVGAQA